jgi:hypothetical protein
VKTLAENLNPNKGKNLQLLFVLSQVFFSNVVVFTSGGTLKSIEQSEPSKFLLQIQTP